MAPPDAIDPSRPERRWYARPRIAIPIGTLAVLAIAIAVAAIRREPWTPPRFAPPPTASLPPLELPSGGAALSGRVIGADARPVPDALVLVHSGAEPRWTYTDASGAFALDGLDPAPWTVSVVAHGYSPARVVLAQGAAHEIDLGPPRPPPPELPPIHRSTLSGRVIAKVEIPLEGAEVLLWPTAPLQTFGGALPRRVPVAADGGFEVEDLAAGEYTVRVLPSWARSGTWPDLVRPLGAEPLLHRHGTSRTELAGELSIELASGGARGTLSDTDGSPLEGALVLIAPDGEPSRVWPPVAADERGAFAFGDLPEGAYRVSVRAGASLVERTIAVRAGETAIIDFGPIDARADR